MTGHRLADRSADRTCVLVLGMHRSGTSLTTRVISLLGAALPKNMMPPAPGNNILGFWEPARLASLHDEMLAEAGSSWDDWRGLDLDARLPGARLGHYKAEIAREITASYEGARLFVLKEPRVCRFVPLYEDVLRDMGIAVRVVVTLRNPAAVAASLRARDGIPEDVGRLYWLRHLLDAEAATRDLPRAFVEYEALLRDWRSAIDPIASRLGIAWPRHVDDAAAEIEAFISPEHDHSPRFSREPSGESSGDWFARGHRAARRLPDHEREAMATLDEIAAEFAPMAAIFGPTVGAERAARDRALAWERSRAESLLQELRTDAADRAEETARLRQELRAERAAHDESAALQRAAFTTQIAAATARQAELADDVARLCGTLAAQRAAAEAALEAARGEAERALAAVRAEHDAERDALRADMASQRDRWEAAESAATAAFRAQAHRLGVATLANAKLERELSAFDGLHLRRSLDGLRRLRLRTVGCRTVLRPLNDLSPAGDTTASWRITGDDPQFDLDWGAASPLPPGHYRLTWNAPTSGSPRKQAKLYIDTGAGYSEAESLDLAISTERPEHWFAAFVLPRGARSLRLDPGPEEPIFTMAAARLRRVPRLSRGMHLAKRILAAHRGRPVRLLGLPLASLFTLVTGGRKACADFLRRAAAATPARPAASWESRAVRLDTARPHRDVRPPPSIAIHAHVFYVDLLEEVATCIAAVPYPAAVYVSTTMAEHAPLIEERLRTLRNVTGVTVRVVENRGRDIAPMLLEFGPSLARADLVAHLHTKRSPHDVALRGWRHYLYDAAFGSPEVVAAIVDRFAAVPDLALLFPAPYIPVRPFMRIGANAAAIRGLLARLGTAAPPPRFQDDFFPAGSVFWCRGSVVRRLVELNLAAADFEPEAGQVDGTLAHALERILPTVAGADGQVAEEYVLDDRKVGESRREHVADVADELILDHDLGGGTRVFTNHRVGRLLAAGHAVHRLFFDPADAVYTLHSADPVGGGVVRFESLDAVRDWYRDRRIRRIVVNSLVGFPSPDACVALVVDLKRLHGAALVYHTHDFYSLCPSQHLLDGDNRYCGVPRDQAVCAACSLTNRNMWHFGGRGFVIERWRQAFQRLMDACDEVVVFDESSVDVVRRGLTVPDARIRVRPHERPVALRPVRPPAAARLHVGLIGTLNHYKGVDVANALARFIAANALDTPLTLVGSSVVPLADTITVLGPYRIPDLPKLVETHGITVFFVCSIAPETFCYTLDELMAMELPVVSFALGAQGRRTAGYRRGTTLDVGTPIDEVYRAIVEAHEHFSGAR